MRRNKGKNGSPVSFVSVGCIAAVTIAISACSTTPPKAVGSKQKSKEYFSEQEYGVKASPRVSMKASNLERGGGRYQVGKPYMVKGKWYYPKEVKSYTKVGKASWYGAAFHGRLTANGEVYDMTHLTAAHPTLPLPSYARVTNLDNGNSVIVRVNDRGPFAHDRVIDLSKRAAELLDYTENGIAKVKVDYVGEAPLHGQDEAYLLASYHPAGGSPEPANGLATGVMIALNGPTPVNSAIRPPSIIGSGSVLPETGPILPDRPDVSLIATVQSDRLKPLAYAGDEASVAGSMLEKFAAGRMNSEDVVSSWKRQRHVGGSNQTAVFLGTFSDPSDAMKLARAFDVDHRVEMETVFAEGTRWISVTVWSAGAESPNALVEKAWKAGAVDAMILRD